MKYFETWVGTIGGMVLLVLHLFHEQVASANLVPYGLVAIIMVQDYSFTKMRRMAAEATALAKRSMEALVSDESSGPSGSYDAFKRDVLHRISTN